MEGIEETGAVKLGEVFIPRRLFDRMVRSMLDKPCPDKKDVLRDNQIQIDEALDRNDRAEFDRLVQRRQWIEREWGRFV